MSQHWYAARAKPSQEHIALDQLRRQSFLAYYPQIQIERIKAGKVVKVTEGLFPGYLFINFELEAASWRSINGTRGVQRLLSFADDGRPSAIPDGEVENLKERESKGLFKFSEVRRFKKGDEVKVKNGNAVGLNGIVLRTRGERVEFLLSLLGRKVRCITPSHTLVLVSHGLVR